MVTSETLGLLVSKLTEDDKYSCYKSENFREAIQIQLSKTLRIFYEFFIAFLEATSQFPHVEKRDELHSSSNCETIDSEIRGYKYVWKTQFQDTLE